MRFKLTEETTDDGHPRVDLIDEPEAGVSDPSEFVGTPVTRDGERIGVIAEVKTDESGDVYCVMDREVE